jgi:hypothetical protein
MEPDDSFAPLVMDSYSAHLRQQLSVRGTWLDDISVLQLFYRMARAKRYAQSQVRLVDCCLLEAALRGRSEKRAENVRYLRRDFLNVPLVLVPLVCGAHWSLLCFRTRGARWYHMDSLAPFHARLAQRTVAALEREGVAPRRAGEVERLTVPQQRETWECGLYTLQYALMVCESSISAGGGAERTFLRELKLHRDIACDGNLLLFTQRVLEIV